MSPYPLNFTSNITINEICFTDTCIETASSILSSINMNIDPCSDFYQYACGNWIQNAIIPEDLIEYGVLDAEAYKNKEKLRAIFDGSYEDLLSATISPKSYQVDDKNNRKIDKKNFNLLKDYYTACVDVQTYESDILLPFLMDLKVLQDETKNQIKRKDTFQITPILMDILSSPQYSLDGMVVDVGGLFSLEIYSNNIDTSKKFFLLTPPKDNKEYEYKTMMDLVSSVLGSKNYTERDQNRIKLMEEIGMKTLSNPELYAMVDSTVSLQERLVELAGSISDYDRHTYTVSEAKDEFAFVDWTSILASSIPQIKDTSNISIQVYNIEYFKELSYYATIDDPTRPIHKDAIANHFMIYKIATEASKLDSELRQIIPDSTFQTRSSICIEKVLERFGLAAGRFYSMITFGGESDKARLEAMATNIKRALIKRIQNADWLDVSTKNSATKKLRMMQTSIGYSTFSPDERSPQDIRQFMHGLETDFDTFYETDRATTRWRLQTYWDTLGERLNSTSWMGIITPQTVNAFNLLSKNSIFVSASFVQKPNYDRNYPDYFNYAGIGQSIGHEYSHGFDDLGSQYDEHGEKRDWWSIDTKAKYAKKTKCFVDEYSKASITDKRGKSYFVDGKLTLGESIADHEGLTAAYYAYLTSKTKGKGYNPILPGLHNFSAESLFFINAARSFCSKTTAEAENDSLYDEHAPDAIRVNMLFRNNIEFAKVFNCPIGSKMHPSEEKCQIWLISMY